MTKVSEQFSRPIRIEGILQRPCRTLETRLHGCLDSQRDGRNADHDIGWKNAVSTAARWLGSLEIPRDLQGKTIDLRDAASSLPYDLEYKRMVLEAAKRNLKKRGAREVILPE